LGKKQAAVYLSIRYWIAIDYRIFLDLRYRYLAPVGARIFQKIF